MVCVDGETRFLFPPLSEEPFNILNFLYVAVPEHYKRDICSQYAELFANEAKKADVAIALAGKLSTNQVLHNSAEESAAYLFEEWKAVGLFEASREQFLKTGVLEAWLLGKALSATSEGSFDNEIFFKDVAQAVTTIIAKIYSAVREGIFEFAETWRSKFIPLIENAVKARAEALAKMSADEEKKQPSSPSPG